MLDGNKTRAIGIDQVAREVDDIDAALEFYRELFENGPGERGATTGSSTLATGA